MKRNKKGFIFIETIVTVVILSVSLLVVYNAYSNSIQKEKQRLYNDDIAYIYRTNNIRLFLEKHSNIDNIKNYAFIDNYIITIGPNFANMFSEENEKYKKTLENIYNNFHINQMLLVKADYITNCNETTIECTNSENNLNYNLVEYLKTLNETTYNYYLVIEYGEIMQKNNTFSLLNKCNPGIDANCHSQYVSLGI